MFLSIFENGQVSVEHEGALNWRCLGRIDRVYFCRASFISLLVLNNLGSCATLRLVWLHVAHEEVKNSASNVNTNELLDESLVFSQVDQNVDNACTNLCWVIILAKKAKHTFAELEPMEQLSILSSARIR